MEAFSDLRQRMVWIVIGQDSQQGAADQRQVGQQVRIAAARTILAHQGVTAPVVADFHPSPMAADESKPLLGAVWIRRGAGEVVAAFRGGVSRFLDGPLAAHHNQGSGKGKIGGHRFEGEGVELANFDSSMGALGVGKKGVLFNESRARACWSR